MLSQKDIKKISSVVRQTIYEEMQVKGITVQRRNKETGAIELKTIDIDLREWIACELPNLAAALRGVQETADHAKNNSIKTYEGLNQVANIIMSLEKPMKQIASITSEIPEAQLIEGSS